MSGALVAGATLVGAGVSAGVGGAASAAATKAQQQMAEMQMKYLDQALRPYRRAGKYGAKREQEMADLYAQNLERWTSPYTREQYEQSPLYTPMVRNLAELQATPGYQFELQQGQQALAQQAAARGGLLSGAQQRAAGNYAQKQAATGFQNAWQRAQQAYQSAFAQNMAQNQNAANMTAQSAGLFGGIANRGMQAASASAQGMAQQGQLYSDAQAGAAYGKRDAINQGVQGVLGAGLSIYDIYNRGAGAGGFGGPYGPNK